MENPMTQDSDLIKLYSGRILALAADMPRTGRLDTPMATVRKRSPLCGSTITVDVDIADDVVTDYAQNVKACALGQAAAAVVGASVVGQNRASIQRGRDALYAMLTENGPIPPAPWQDLEVLQPAADYKNRHASIMLAFDAILQAFEDINEPCP